MRSFSPQPRRADFGQRAKVFQFAVVSVNQSHVFLISRRFIASPSSFQKKFSTNDLTITGDFDEILEDKDIDLVAAIPASDQTLSLARHVLHSGKDLLATKPLFTKQEELDAARLLVAPRRLPFFSQLMKDCVDHEDSSMLQERVFKACEMALQAQQLARSFNGVPTSTN